LGTPALKNKNLLHLMIMSYGFQSPKKLTLKNSNGDGLGHMNLNYLPNNTILLVMVKKFDPHPILVNVNKFKPYQLSMVSQGQESRIQGWGRCR